MTTKLAGHERDLEMMRHPERWPLGRKLPLRHGTQMDRSVPDLRRTAVVVVCPHGDLCLAEDANVFALPHDPSKWRVATPEEVVARGWEVD